ncbi:MAG: alpha-amylase family protein, partial [Cyclobacteriaceae bacterium]|nr:alpha-amylase family protein [Cyclobacteriaceae bacterium HetDA_MAG_MS6]
TGAIEHAVLTDYTQYGIALDDADVVKGRAGSPYAIKDYYDVNPDLAVDVNNRMDEFESLIARTHQAGMKVLIDFVPNHVARGYQSDAKPANTTDFGEDDDATQAFSINNNFYYLPDRPFVVPQDYNPLGEHTHPTKDGKFDESPAKATGNDVFSATPSVHDWFETIKLNYGVDYQNGRSVHFEETPDTWLKVKDILLFWAAKGVDGFRCDMAEMVPVEFWNWITAEIKRKHPEVVFIAEIYNPDAYRNYIFKGGFDYLYDKVELYDTLKHIIQQKATTDDITAIWQRQEGISDKMLRFLENHDEQRIASPDFAADMRKGIPMMAATAFMHTGPVMLYFGQDVGEPGMGESGFSGDDGRTTIFDYWGVPEHQKWMNDGLFDGAKLSSEQRQLQSAYQTILAAINTSEAIRAGGFFDLHYFNRNESYQGYSDMVYTFLRHTEDEAVLVAINFSEAYETAQIKIPVEAWEKINIHKGRILMTWTGGKAGVNRRTTEDYDQPSELVLKLEPLSYQLIRLQEKIK